MRNSNDAMRDEFTWLHRCCKQTNGFQPHNNNEGMRALKKAALSVASESCASHRPNMFPTLFSNIFALHERGRGKAINQPSQRPCGLHMHYLLITSSSPAR